MTLSPDLLSLLRCPESGNALTETEQGLKNESGEIYPFIKNIPWLLPHPRNSLLDWGTKLNHFQQVLLSEVGQLEKELRQSDGLSRTRLQTLLDGKKQFIVSVTQLLEPLTRAKVAPKEVYDSLRDRAPSTQNLLSYEANLYRDWLWGEEENKRSLEIVEEQLPKQVGKLAVFGAGACRLAYDVHTGSHPALTVAADINPLLLLAADKILAGEGFDLIEFPLHPKNSECVAVQQHFSGIMIRPDNFYLTFCDATKPAFVKAAFDTLLTPWLIDIQPFALQRFLNQLNHYLPVGGSWVNFGTLVFNQRRDALCYSVEEISSLAEAAGFQLGEISQHEIPYLKSPYNAGYRIETVWSWRAEKVRDCVAESDMQVLPEWILNTKAPIPAQTDWDKLVHQHRSYAMLLAEVDGRTSLAQIGKKYARQNKVQPEEAENLVRQFFLDLYQQINR